MYWITMVTGVVEIAIALSLPLFFFSFSGVSTLIYTTSLFHLNPTCGQLMVYTDTCPFSPLQKSSGVVAVFPQIFLCSHLLCTFMAHVPITRASQKVILIIRIYTRSMFSLSKEIFLLGLRTHALDQSPKPNCMIWAHDPTHIKLDFKNLILIP